MNLDTGKTAEQMIQELIQGCNGWEKQARTAEARVRELEQALEKYGGHLAEESCMGIPCTCGLKAALQGTDKAVKS
jgi:hypothetical protein